MLHLSDLHLTPGQRRKQRLGRRPGRARPRPGRGDRRQHGAPGSDHRRRAGLRAAVPLPGRLRLRVQRLQGAGVQEPVRVLQQGSRVRPGRRPARTRSCAPCSSTSGWVDLNNARTTLKAGGRSVELVGVDDPHVQRDAYPIGGRPDLAYGRRAHRGDPHARAVRCSTPWPPTGSRCCWPGTPTADRSACPASEPWSPTAAWTGAWPRGCTGGHRPRLAARVRRTRHPSNRTDPVRLPARGVTPDPGAPLTSGPAPIPA